MIEGLKRKTSSFFLISVCNKKITKTTYTGMPYDVNHESGQE